MKAIITLAVLVAGITAYLAVRSTDAPVQPDSSSKKAADQVSLSQPSIRSQSEDNAEQVDDGTEIVLGLRVRKDRDCDVELKDYVTPDGDMFSAWSCTPRKSQPMHVYSHYDDATLDAMAWSDAEAAALLGKRLIERNGKKSWDLLVRAAALDGDFRHLAWLADQRFGIMSVDGEPHMGNLGRQYQLASVSRELGDLSGRSGYFRRQLVDAGAQAADLAELDSQADQLLRRIREIQSTVLGEVTIGGQDDV
jgi:hypothetical protein